jgi:hypothetical protein
LRVTPSRSPFDVAPDLTDELYLMAEDMHSKREKPVHRRFNQLLDALEAARARYAIIGAVAMGAHGAERYTKDIDVLVAEPDLAPVVAQLAGALTEIGREPQDGPPKQVRLRSKRAKTARAIDVDLLFFVPSTSSSMDTRHGGSRGHDRRSTSRRRKRWSCQADRVPVGSKRRAALIARTPTSSCDSRSTSRCCGSSCVRTPRCPSSSSGS